MESLDDRILEFFDLETETENPARLQLRRFELAKDVLTQAVAEPRAHARVLEVAEQASSWLAPDAKVSAASAGFLAAGLAYLRQSGEPDRHAELFHLAKSLRTSEAPDGFRLAFAESALRLGHVEEAAKAAPRHELLRVRLARLQGRAYEARATLERADGAAAAWQRTLTEFLVTKDQSRLVRGIKERESEVTPSMRLEAYLLCRAVSTDVHHRLQTPRYIERNLIKRRDCPLETLNLLDACLILEGLDAAPFRTRVQMSRDLVRAARRLADLEWAVHALAAGIRAFAKHGDALLRDDLIREFAATTHLLGKGSAFDPLQVLASKDSAGASTASTPLPLALLKHAAGLTRPGVSPARREAEALKSFASILSKLSSLRGFLQKTAQFSATMSEILTGEEDPDLERVFFSGAPLDEAETTAALASYRVDRSTYSSFQTTPVASGSIGQCHRATLPDGTAVAVKVKYPGIEKRLSSDAKLIGAAAKVLALTARQAPLEAMVAPFTELCLMQCDFVREAANQEQMRRALAHNPRIGIPRVHADRSNENVIVQNWVEGQTVFQFAELADAAAKEEAARSLVEWMFGSVAAGMFYFDVHPGNFRFEPSGKLWVLDFGAVLPVERGVGEVIPFLQALKKGDQARMFDLLQAGGLLGPGDQGLAESMFGTSRDLILKPFVVDQAFRFDLAYVREVVESFKQLQAKGGQVPTGASISNLRFYWSFYGLLAKVGAEANYSRMVAPFLS